jgi:hypothetical protein
MYVLSIIRNFILYIGFTYMYICRIIFCMVLSTWLHTKILYEGLDNVFVFPNLQTPSFKYSQVIFAPLQKFVLMSSQCKLLSQQLCKATPLTYDLGSTWHFAETWKSTSTTISQNFNTFNFIKWNILLLPWSHLKLELEHKMTYNSFSVTPNSLRFWETHQIHVFYICSKFQLYWWQPQRVMTLKRNWLPNWGWNFKYLNFSQHISKWLENSCRYLLLYDLWNCKAADPKKLKQRRYDQKTRSDT